MVETCPTCLGTGEVVWVIDSKLNKTEKPIVNPCHSCSGRGLVISELAEDIIDSNKPFYDE